jgi:hypothetical protein
MIFFKVRTHVSLTKMTQSPPPQIILVRNEGKKCLKNPLKTPIISVIPLTTQGFRHLQAFHTGLAKDFGLF